MDTDIIAQQRHPLHRRRFPSLLLPGVNLVYPHQTHPQRAPPPEAMELGQMGIRSECDWAWLLDDRIPLRLLPAGHARDGVDDELGVRGIWWSGHRRDDILLLVRKAPVCGAGLEVSKGSMRHTNPGGAS